MNKTQELKQNAENCADLAATAKDERAKRRYERMEEAWNALAKTQAWLEGEKGGSPC
jgi:flagellar capping protein FliD